eukprot:scaffold11303_cov51-Phaeocystis_antarctica.AAC.2
MTGLGRPPCRQQLTMVLIGFAVTDDNVRLITNSHGRRRYRAPRDFESALGPPVSMAGMASICLQREVAFECRWLWTL